MKVWKQYRKKVLALLMSVSLASGSIFVPVAAQENSSEIPEAVVESIEDLDQPETLLIEEETEADIKEEVEVIEPSEEKTMMIGEDSEEEMDTEIIEEETEIFETETDILEEETESETESESDIDLLIAPEEAQQAVEGEQIYDMQVTFDGVTLGNDNHDFTWTNTDAKSMSITLTRKKEVEAEADKNYVVCIRVPEMFYFSGIPDAASITGVEEVTLVKNACPKVYNSAGNQIDLPGFSQYSGEMRFRLNTSVDNITIPNLGIIYNKELIGYTGTSQSVNEPVTASLIAVSNNEDINGFTDSDKTELASYKVPSIAITTGSVRSSNLKNAMSIDGFATNGVNEQSVQLGKNDTITYACSTAGQANQYYKTLKVEFDCPYIEINNKKYYLSFDVNDTALSSNQQGTKTGYHMLSEATYDENKHTFSYTFQDIYLGGHTVLFYSPNFSWPAEEKIKDKSVDSELQIIGGNWRITEQTCYTDAKGTLKENFEATKYFAYYYPEGVNVTLTSSDQAPQGENIAKRRIYKGITRKNGIEGALGFFDIHNKGTVDSPEVTISFNFNTDSSDSARYYITKVNLPVYDNESGVDVTYTLSNGTETVTGTRHYDNNSSFSCLATELRSSSNVGSDYYIQSLSYRTKLKRGTAYHLETAHLWRNRANDQGLYFGYLEGNVGESAHATMSIKADNGASLNSSNQAELSSTEKSTIGENKYIAFSMQDMTLEGGTSAAITAGDSVTLKFGANISSEEYYGVVSGDNRYVNGYHVFEDGIFYVCLPEGISISGTEQVKVQRSGNTMPATSVQKIGSSFQVNDQMAQWWQIEVDDIRQSGGKAFTVEIQLATALQMNSLSWNFQNCVAIRAKGQPISWGAAGSNAIYNTTGEMKNPVTSVGQLKQYLTDKNDTSELGLNIYSNANAKLTVARAEAKLDVETGLNLDAASSNQTNVKISANNTDISYDVTISSEDGGYAENFAYYIPIVGTNSATDANMLVSRKEFDLQLAKAVEIDKKGAKTADSDLPFEVYYTTDSSLTGATIRNDTVKWQSESELSNNFSGIRAVKIVTKSNAMIKNGESYRFRLTLQYAKDQTIFNTDAGSVVQWRSFGYYTYVRNDATTTATYPSQLNKVTVCYQKDMTGEPLVVSLKTDASSNVVNAEKTISETFKNTQTFKVKKVVTNGVQLISTDPATLTGNSANTQFNVAFNINNMANTAAQLSSNGTGTGKQWTVNANGSIRLQTEVKFSKALTDQVTGRYLDVTIGNENVDIVFRIRLDRSVKAATAEGSGVASGANYQVPNVTDQCTIAQNSAFTALYVLKFVPGNYQTQKLSWKDSSAQIQSFPQNTKITMMEISDNSTVDSFWYYKTSSNENSIDLKNFKRMSGTDTYQYDTTAAVSQNAKYMFVIDFSEAKTTAGTYKIEWEGMPKETDNSIDSLSYSYTITLTAEKTYQLSSQTTSGAVPEATISYTVSAAENDSYIAYRSLALVLKPTVELDLPADTKLVCGEQVFLQNADGYYLVPIENIESGEKTFTLQSDMFPDKQATYSFQAQLYLAKSVKNISPMNGEKVGSETTVTFKKMAQSRLAFKVTGDQIGTVSEWSAGKTLEIAMRNISDGKVTVTAYEGLTGTQQVTNLLSSVAGIFTIQSGVGTYKAEAANTKQLKLSSNAQPGTYRLIFDVKDSDGNSVMQVPYYIIVRPSGTEFSVQ